MQLLITTTGVIRCLYDEAITLGTLGHITIVRASHVEPDSEGLWWADLAPVRGPRLGPFDRRSAALDAESNWLSDHVLSEMKTDCPYYRNASLRQKGILNV